MGREFELKFRATEAQFAALLGDFSGLTEIKMETTYYDSHFFKLMPLRWTLRRRMENEKSVCTLKIPGQDHACGEWEVECQNIMAAIPKLCQLGAPMELMAHTVSGVIPVCGARFIRLAGHLEQAECSVELALDQGVLTGGNRERPFQEVEVECKGGSEAAAEKFALELAEKYGLTPESRSKYARALALAQGETHGI